LLDDGFILVSEIGSGDYKELILFAILFMLIILCDIITSDGFD